MLEARKLLLSTNLTPVKRAALRVLVHPDYGKVCRRELVRRVIEDDDSLNESSVETAIKRELKLGDAFPKTHPHTKLNILQETCIAGLLLHCDRKGVQLTSADVLQLAKDTLPEVGKTLSMNWVSGFKKRMAVWLSSHKSSAMEPARVNSLKREYIDHFIASYDTMKRHILPDGSNLVNADEVPCTYAGVTAVSVLTAFGRPKTGSLNNKSEDVRTFVPFTAANGRLLMVVVIFKATRKAGNQVETPILVPQEYSGSRKPPFHVFYAATAKGYVTTDLWRSIMAQFHLVAISVSDTKGVVLLVDNLSAHVNASVVKECESKNIYTWYIPPHTSHFLQPNDNGVNAAAKAKAHELKRRETRALVLRGITPSSIVARILLEAIEASITSPVIRASWYRTGIHPWDPDLIRDLAEPYLPATESPAPPSLTDAAKEFMEDLAANTFKLNTPSKVERTRIGASAQKCFTYEEINARNEAKLKAAQEVAEAKAAKAAARQEKAAAVEAKKAANRARRDTRRLEKADKESRAVRSATRKTCSGCTSVRGYGMPWFNCHCNDQPGMCPSCHRKASNNPDAYPWCGVCENPLVAGC